MQKYVQFWVEINKTAFQKNKPPYINILCPPTHSLLFGTGLILWSHPQHIFQYFIRSMHSSIILSQWCLFPLQQQHHLESPWWSFIPPTVNRSSSISTKQIPLCWTLPSLWPWQLRLVARGHRRTLRADNDSPQSSSRCPNDCCRRFLSLDIRQTLDWMRNV